MKPLYETTIINLTFPQYLMLLVLWEEDHLLMKEIGTRIGFGTGTLNPILNRMIAQGRLSKEDKRGWIISLTEKAKSEHEPISQAVYEKLASCNFLDVNTLTLMKNLKGLNAFFEEMNL